MSLAQLSLAELNFAKLSLAILMCSFDDKKLKFQVSKNPSCLKPSRILLKNNDTLLELKRSWRFLTGARILDQVFDVFI